MELEIKNGRYVEKPYGGVSTVDGQQEKIQRIMMRLAARRGGFAPMPDFGSRLYTLTGMKPSVRKSAAQQAVHEALADEEGVSVKNVECSDGEGESIVVSVILSIAGEEVELKYDF